ncbi:MAG: 50S ribosomal protein L10 [Crenarchaeota archaeon]|nr:50S ribosomal protein L10 [Thermoproteota archaeon]
MLHAVMIKRRKKIPEWKVREVEELAELIKQHPVIGIASIEGVPTAQLQKIKKKLHERYGDRIVTRVAKNTLFRLALSRAGIEPEKLEKYLTGSNMFIFTDMNPFELALILDKTRVTAPAKPGMKAPCEITIPAGDTGFRPGPIMSVFGKLKIPIRVQKGTIWITKDVVAAKPGDEISPELASLLQKLGIEPIEVKISLKAAYDHGLVIPGEELHLDLKEYESKVIEAAKAALWVGVEIGYPEPEVLKIAIPVAVRRALMVAAEAGYVTPETAEFVIRHAVAKALAVVAALGDKAKELGIEVTIAAPQQPEKKEEEKKEEEEKEEEEKEAVSEEELAAGLEGLFGF